MNYSNIFVNNDIYILSLSLEIDLISQKQDYNNTTITLSSYFFKSMITIRI